MATSEADGEIVVTTELDTEGFRSGSKELHAAINSLNNGIKKLEPVMKKALDGSAKALENFDAKSSSLEDAIADIEEKMQDLATMQGPTREYTALQEQAAKADAAVDNLYRKMKKMRATGVSEHSQTWKSLQYDIEQATIRAAKYDERVKAMEADGSAYTSGVSTAAYQQLASTLELLKNKFDEMQDKVDEARPSSSALQRAWEKMRSTGKELVKNIGSAASRMGLFRKQSNSCTTAVQRLTKKVGSLWTMFKLRFVRSLVSGAVQAVKDGIGNLSRYSSAMNKNMSALKTSMTQLKNSFATAFAPLLSVVTPALTSFIDAVSRAVTYVGMLIAALTGAKTFTKAVTAQEDYAKSLTATGKAAKDAKRQLASFDDLNILSKDTSSDGSASVGDMFKTVPITSSLADFASQLRAAVEAKDFDFVGELIGGKINAGIEKLRGIVTADGVKAQIAETASGIAQALNGIVDTVDWVRMGDTVAQGFNLLVLTIYTFLSTTDWKGIGNALAGSLNGAVEGIDWAAVAQTLSSYVIGLMDAIIGFIEEADWQQIGRSVAEFLANIDWSGLASALLEGIGAILGALGELIVGLGSETIFKALAAVVALIAAKIAGGALLSTITSALGTALTGILATIGTAIAGWPAVIIAAGIAALAAIVIWIKSGGSEVAEGFLQGILDGIAGIGTWIKEHIFEPFIEGFKTAFGIHSPSTVMAEQGNFIIEGLLNGLKEAWKNIPAFFTSALSDVKATLSAAFSTLKSNALTWGKDIISNLASGIKKGIGKVGEAVTGVADKIKSLIGFSEPEDGPLSNFHTYMPDMLDLMAQGIRRNRDKAVDAVAEVASAISDEVQGGTYSVGSISVGRVTGLSSQLNSVAAMMQAATAVANSAAYRAPSVAIGSIAPYSVTARIKGSDSDNTNALLASNDALGAKLIQTILEAVRDIIAAIEANGGGGDYDSAALTSAVIREINRRTRVAGSSPLLG